MPKGEIEKHPYLNDGKIDGALKLILGSFPVYECTDNDNPIKQQTRNCEGTMRFFYGSNRNSLWTKYKKYIDNNLSQPWDKDNILKSLKENLIAISDIIESCERYTCKTNKTTGQKSYNPFSSEDSALHKQKLNKDLLQEIIKSGTTKILCTSKAVLGNLEQHIICSREDSIGTLELNRTQTFHNNFITNLNGNTNMKNPIVRVFKINNNEVTAIAIPSPGSPQRKIKEFGYVNGKSMDYAEKYFQESFEWFKQ